ncbi:MAG: hypothetical protein K2M00_04600 [Muribaculaceae bacterium]|nr:hypothetical protein [Muribaculaceae bacterium]
MKRFKIITLLAVICTLFQSCADHDDPKLEPIDTTKVKITASVAEAPNYSWFNVTEEITIKVSNVEMTAPKGVILRSISLIANNGSMSFTIDDKPYSGEPLEFKIPLRSLQGRINFSLRGNLIKKASRDAQIIIADNIQKIVFSETPEFECKGWLYVSVKSKSTTGEEYEKSFEVESIDHFTIPVPRTELYWEPTSGTASTLEIALGCGATAWSPNTTFDCKITHTAIGHSSGDESTLRTTISNTPGALNDMRLQVIVSTTYFGTWEDVTIDPYNLSNYFSVVESE